MPHAHRSPAQEALTAALAPFGRLVDFPTRPVHSVAVSEEIHQQHMEGVYADPRHNPSSLAVIDAVTGTSRPPDQLHDVLGHPNFDGLELMQDNGTVYRIGQHTEVIDGHPRSVVDLQVYDSGGQLIALDSFKGQRISTEEKKLFGPDTGGHGHGGGHGGGHGHSFLEQWPDGTGEFLLFMAHHEPAAIAAARQRRSVRSSHSKRTYLEKKHDNKDFSHEPIMSLGWDRKIPAAELPAADRRHTKIAVTLPENRTDKSILSQVMEHREKLPLREVTLNGLTFDVGGIGGRTYQVTGDLIKEKLVHGPTRAENRQERMLFVTEYAIVNGPIGPVRVPATRHKVSLAQLEDMLNQRSPADRTQSAYTNLHWEIPRAAYWAGRADSMGRVASGPLVRIPGAGTAREKFFQAESKRNGFDAISLQIAAQFLSSPEVFDEAEVMQRATALLADPAEAAIAQRLVDQIRLYGTARITALARELADQFTTVAAQLGLSVRDEQTSLSWALRQIAIRNLARPKNRQIRQQKRAIVDNEIGLAFVDQVLRPRLDVKDTPRIGKRNTLKTDRKVKLGMAMDSQPLSKLMDFVSPEISTKLNQLFIPVTKKALKRFVKGGHLKIKDVPERLSDEPELWKRLTRGSLQTEFQNLGRLLRRQIQQ